MSVLANHHPNPGTNSIISGSSNKDSDLPVFAARRSTNSISFMPASFREGFVTRCKITNVTKAEKILSASLALTCIIVLILVVLVLCMFLNPKIIMGLVSEKRCLAPVCVSSGNTTFALFKFSGFR